jgi:hypothetical protein
MLKRITRQTHGAIHALTILPVLGIGVFLPLAGGAFAQDLWPEQPHLVGTAAIVLTLAGCLFTAAAGRWLAPRWTAADPHLAIAIATVCVLMPFLRTEAPLLGLLTRFVILILPVVSFCYGLGLMRWSWGRYRFVAVWLIALGLLSSFGIMAMLVDGAQVSQLAKGLWAMGYVAVATIAAILAGRALRRRWQQDIPRGMTVLAPVLPLIVLSVLNDMPLMMRALLAILTVTPFLGFAIGLLGFRRRPAA